jgi:hypothetical protein
MGDENGETKAALSQTVLMFKVMLFDIISLRHSLARLYRVVRRERRRIKELEKKISSFVEPN